MLLGFPLCGLLSKILQILGSCPGIGLGIDVNSVKKLVVEFACLRIFMCNSILQQALALDVDDVIFSIR